MPFWKRIYYGRWIKYTTQYPANEPFLLFKILWRIGMDYLPFQTHLLHPASAADKFHAERKSYSRQIFLKRMATFAVICLMVLGFRTTAFLEENYPMTQVSVGLPMAYHQYYDVPAWNCDGSLFLIRGEKASAYVVRKLGQSPQLLKLTPKPDGYLQWDTVRPENLYFIKRDNDHTHLYRVDIRTGKTELIYDAEGDLDMAPPHPDGEHLLLHPRIADGRPALIYSLRTGKVQSVPMPGPVHRVRFTTAPDLALFCNIETRKFSQKIDDRTSWTIDSSTGKANLLFRGEALHPDWQPGGKYISFFQNNALRILEADGKLVTEIPGLNGHQSWSYDGRFIVADIFDTAKSKYKGWIVVVDVAQHKVIPIVKHQAKYETSQTTHPHAHFSPDGTKIIYNSNHFGTTKPQVVVVDVSEVTSRLIDR